MNIIKHKPILEVTTKDGEVYFVDAEAKGKLKEALNTEKFIELGGDLISVYEIKHVKKAKCVAALANYPSNVRKMVSMRRRDYIKAINKVPSDEKMIEWAKKASNGEQI